MKNTNKKGICQKKRAFFGMVTVTNKGQIAIPSEARKEMDIKTGDKLLVIKRADGKGINLIKSDTIDDFIQKASRD
ncbi:hypothetical protein CO134_03205 [Candidatus Kuenenbacteria bacterium CG_4_9_14_3_um_filter_39_14]|uniref:SpoVT-AbrB domain-containing protein n=5 Tax=Candidatus Kueneniibacteriota TaxID=1752740 RepID=A0A2M7ILZ1_9BACT|nr:MAG: hypothetical protein AUK13_01670 [Candidatus Kuenenbacteria bacterium CG2_30_39_24]PIP28986.1 MAG: hypothetical protein COX28_01600 [Candidatus Kuenenbacteria bacterium CG23_combo_of_CG06-09_8_20_14_all_39_39]PIR80927.1 MAG: hypothetical protein COU24_01365 [Candidatus Kuenenbacteria bacterium CG10_big_fil_rev_8_21_14_0_10_39_14]PIW95823.1 MAG: hypothetical protein COZ84_01440 [Candidatus Kuenenbacteria bacterium CG_4_8_14_3_um_filter_39_15]PJA91847.1 MAG: hypothetical protein CO134_032